jgi:hypothetical protein
MAIRQPIPANPRFQDLAGQTFGLWVVLRFAGQRKGKALWHCRCICGAEKAVQANNLKRGGSRSCGCDRDKRSRERETTHGMKRAAEYTAWQAMKDRCLNPRSHKWADYGGRGIAVCKAWLDFVTFYADMGPKPSPAHSLERIDNDGNYEPGNVRWATMAEQALNKRNNRLLIWQGKTLPLTEWCRRLGVNLTTVWGRLNRGWSVADALSTPAGYGATFRRNNPEFPGVNVPGDEPVPS